MQPQATTPSTNHCQLENSKLQFQIEENRKVERENEPVESRYGNNVSRKETKIKQASGKRENAVDELLAGLTSVAGDGEWGSSTCGGYASEALADVREGVIGHLGNWGKERRGLVGSPSIEVSEI